mgnify:CR=1 FL=1
MRDPVTTSAHLVPLEPRQEKVLDVGVIMMLACTPEWVMPGRNSPLAICLCVFESLIQPAKLGLLVCVRQPGGQ